MVAVFISELHWVHVHLLYCWVQIVLTVDRRWLPELMYEHGSLSVYLLFAISAQLKSCQDLHARQNEISAKVKYRMDSEIIVPVMGVTGAGKSSFIKLVTGSSDILVGHGLAAGEFVAQPHFVPAEIYRHMYY